MRMTVRNILMCAILLVVADKLSADSHKGWKNSLKPRGGPAPELTLASGGKANYKIVLPAKPTTQEEFAVEELTKWLREMTDAEFPVVREGDGSFTPSGREISVGRTELLKNANLPEASADLAREGYAITVMNKTLCLFGGTTRGPINAVYALLEEDLGCRWYAAPESSDIPHRPELTFRPVPRQFVPTVKRRDAFFLPARFSAIWAMRNRVSAPVPAIPAKWGGHFSFPPGMESHTYDALVPPGQYFEDHPEYYSELGGKRQPIQLCLTNPDVLKIVIARVREILNEHPNVHAISVAPNDDMGYCECARCKAMDDKEGTNAGTLIWFVNAVAEAIENEHPDVKVSTLAYLGTFKAPRTITPHKNVMIHLCITHHWGRPSWRTGEFDDVRAVLEEWARISEALHIWDYVINFANYPAPWPNMYTSTHDIAYYARNKGTGILLQGNYQSPGGDRADMRSWLYVKLLWDPSRQPRELMRDFVYGYYGEAAEPLWKYNEMLWNKGEAFCNMPAKTRKALKLPNCWVSSAGEYWSGIGMFLPEPLMARAISLFDQADKLARDPTSRRRVEMAKVPVLVARICQGVFFEQWDALFGGTRLRNVILGQQDEVDYGKLIDEVERISKREDITRLDEMYVDFPTMVRRWREMLAVTQQTDCILKLNAWMFQTDPKDVGMKETWYAPEHDDAKWGKIRSDLDGGWETQGFSGYTGYGWYRQWVDVPEDFGQVESAFLYFIGIDEEADIYVNGRKILTRTSDTTHVLREEIANYPFGQNVKSALKPGQKNLIAVRVKSLGDRGGIWRPAALVPSSPLQQ